MEKERLLIFGGAGALGQFCIEALGHHYEITNYSRDDSKHWKLDLKFKNLKHIVGDIADRKNVEIALKRVRPHMVFIFSALKHVDRCEMNVNACINTNLTGVKNVLDTIEMHQPTLPELHTCLFVSTDKACSPINLYGMCKAASENLMIDKARSVPQVKFITLRYGNVLNSTGSILPTIMETAAKGIDLKITHPDMTRFFMTLDQCLSLIQYVIQHGQSGDIVIPKLVSMRMIDLLELFANHYGVKLHVTGMRPGEKLHESLINETQALLVEEHGDFYHIRPYYHAPTPLTVPFEMRSDMYLLTRNELHQRLSALGYMKDAALC